MRLRGLAPLTMLLLFLPVMASAHEPLWGETPQTFAFGLIHPEARFGVENNSRLLQGSQRVDNPLALRFSTFTSLFSVQYAPRTTLNVKFELPIVRVAAQQSIGGRLQRSDAAGLGDAVVSLKSRFYQRFGEDWKIHHAYQVGFQMPTGEHGGRYPDGTRFLPSEQPGSGKFGLQLGYAFAWERLQDTVWANVAYRTDFGGGTRRGDMLELNVAYGYWLKRAYRPQDTGVILAIGPNVVFMGRDREGGASVPNSGFTRTGLQATLMVTKNTIQFRIGALVPLAHHVNGTQLVGDVQVRAAWEMFF